MLHTLNTSQCTLHYVYLCYNMFRLDLCVRSLVSFSIGPFVCHRLLKKYRGSCCCKIFFLKNGCSYSYYPCNCYWLHSIAWSVSLNAMMAKIEQTNKQINEKCEWFVVVVDDGGILLLYRKQHRVWCYCCFWYIELELQFKKFKCLSKV